MPRITTLLLLFFCIFEISAQDEVRLPADLRQHNLTTYNSSLFNPVFSLDRNDPESVAFWTRWQWQSIDADPTTLYLNYSRPFKKNSVLGGAFFQHNTGIFFNTGGAINYAHKIQFSESVKLSLGFNLFGFVQELADTRFQTDPTLPIPEPTNDFILQWAPGASISVERMTLSMASENLLDYNFRAKEANTPAADKIFMGMMSYDFPINIGAQKTLLRPSLYLRTIPQQENQIGILSLLRTSKYWAQLGYNNFYGVGIGGGGTFFKKFNLGAMFEFGTSASINTKDPSFEVVVSYFLGNPDERDVAAVYGEDEVEEEVVLAGELNEEEKIKDELEKAEELANEEEPKEEDPDKREAKEVEVESPKEEIEEPEEEEPVTEEISKKEQRQAEKEAAAEEKRLKKEQDRIAKAEEERLEEEAKEKARLAKAEQDRIERDLKEAKAKEEEEAEQAELVEKQKEELQKAEAEKVEQERLAAEKTEAEKSALQKRQDSIAAVQRTAQEAAQQAATKKRLDSIAEARKAQAEAEAQAKEAQRKLDSITQAKAAVSEAEQEEVKPEAGEKYEEVQTEDGLEPGFYLIANVFGTQKYFEAFMADLNNRGLAPKSFLRSLNNYNYVYLERYDTMAEARRARDSKFNGRYNDKTWVFRVVGN